QSRGLNAGQWELNRVSASVANVVTVELPLLHDYAGNANTERAQVVVVLEYTTVDVPSGGQLEPPGWNGDTGGIIAIMAQDHISVDGQLSASGTGYAGEFHGCPRNCLDGDTGESSSSTPNSGPTANGSGGGGGAAGECNGGGGGGYGTSGDRATYGGN